MPPYAGSSTPVPLPLLLQVAEHLKKLKIGPSAANTEDVGQSEWVGPLFARPLKRAHSSLAAPSAVAEVREGRDGTLHIANTDKQRKVVA
jgi:hypothetical protein